MHQRINCEDIFSILFSNFHYFGSSIASLKKRNKLVKWFTIIELTNVIMSIVMFKVDVVRN